MTASLSDRLALEGWPGIVDLDGAVFAHAGSDDVCILVMHNGVERDAKVSTHSG